MAGSGADGPAVPAGAQRRPAPAEPGEGVGAKRTPRQFPRSGNPFTPEWSEAQFGELPAKRVIRKARSALQEAAKRLPGFA